MIAMLQHGKSIVVADVLPAALVVYASVRRHSAQVWKGRAADEKAAHANYREAAKQAELNDVKNVLRAKSEQAAITERITDEYQDRLASL